MNSEEGYEYIDRLIALRDSQQEHYDAISGQIEDLVNKIREIIND